MDNPSPPRETPSPPIEKTSKRPGSPRESTDQPLLKRSRLFLSPLFGTSANVSIPLFDDTQDISGYSASEKESISEFVESSKVPSKEEMFAISEVLSKQMGEDYTRRFEGKYMESHAWILYLQEKLKDEPICFAYSSDTHGGYMLRFEANKEKKSRSRSKFLFVKRDFYTEIEKCRKERPNLRFIIVILQLPNHLNGLIFDFQEEGEKEGVITRFEPHGYDAVFDHEIVDDILKKYFLEGKGEIEQVTETNFTRKRYEDEERHERSYFKNWAYRSPIEFCPRDGPQNIESRIRKKDEKGYCAAWTLLIMHYRITNPEKTDEEVIKYFTKKSDMKLKEMIETYSAWEVHVLDNFKDLPLIYEKGDWVAIFKSAAFRGYGKITEVDAPNYWVHTAVPLYFFSGKTPFSDWETDHTSDRVLKITNQNTIDIFENSVDIQGGDFVEYWDRKKEHDPLVLVGAGRVIFTPNKFTANVLVSLQRVYQNDYGITEAATTSMIPKYKLKKRIFNEGDYVYLHSSVQQITGRRYRILAKVKITATDNENYRVLYQNENRWVSVLDLSTVSDPLFTP